MLWAKVSTAATVTVGPILDSTGAEYTGAVIGDLTIRKHDGSGAAMASAATLSHVDNGYYTLVTTTGNMDTLGRVQIRVNKATYQMPPLEMMVIPATVYDVLVTNATNTTGGLIAATAAVSAAAGYIGNATAALSVDASGRVDVAKVAGTAQTARDLGGSLILRTGLAQGGSSTSITFDSGASSVNDFYLGGIVVPTGGTGGTQPGRRITGYTGSSKIASVHPAWATAPDGTTTFAILPSGVADVHFWNGTALPNGGSPGYPEVILKVGTGDGEVQLQNGYLLVDVCKILQTGLTETSAGYLAAAFIKLLDVATPVFTAASVNQTADNNTILASGTYGNSALKTLIDAVAAQVTALNNLSALINIYGSPLLEIPDSSSTLFTFTVVVRDAEGKLVDLDSSPTLAAANAAGTDRSANLSSVSHPATGRYTFTYSVSSAAAEESLRITVSGTVSSEGRYIEWIGAVVNYDTLTTLAAVKAQTDKLTFDGSNNVAASAGGTAFVHTSGKLWVLDGSGNAVAPASATTAIKAKTDNLPSSPAATGDIPTASQNATATAAQITTDHGSGSYIRNTEPTTPPTAAEVAQATLVRTAAQVKTTAGSIVAGTLASVIQQLQNSNTTDNAGKLTVYDTDDVEIIQLTLASDPDAEPATGVSS